MGQTKLNMKGYIEEARTGFVFLMKKDGYTIPEIASVFNVGTKEIKNIIDELPSKYISKLVKRPSVIAPKKKKIGIVYFLQQDIEEGSIKIGFTQGQLKNRINALQTGCPYRLKFLHAIEANSILESKLHERFCADRLNGEWFYPSQNLLKFIADQNKK